MIFSPAGGLISLYGISDNCSGRSVACNSRGKQADNRGLLEIPRSGTDKYQPMLNGTVERRYLWVLVSPSVCRLTTCCADAPARSHYSLGILRGALHSSPCRMIRIYRRAIADSELAIADSGWAVLFWRLIQREKLTRIFGLSLFKALLETPQARVPPKLFFFFPTLQ